jgi:hypothetical protein
LELYAKAVSPREFAALVDFLPVLERSATTNDPSARAGVQIVKDMAQRMLKLNDRDLLAILDYSSLADFYNIGLLGSVDDPRDVQLRLNIYPDFPGDVTPHTHKTRVSSLIVAGSLTNSMFDGATIKNNPSGDYRVVKPVRTPGKSVLNETGIVTVKPETRAISYERGEAYVVPLGHFHSVTTSPNTVTLCLFKKDQIRGFGEALVLKRHDAKLEEEPPRKMSHDVIGLIRTALAAVVY